ncbi:hypothetical protein Cgig2_024601 [Carnegiea gigantea]|uniref:Uncharacterized protein n=1 Tax=Carnegiea gigantea TaxID=171969 RepID=A0A9Q1KIM5_9CARY|nr:hypothetical protein Cgig2_024601 [Carnegiea gigantea]
MNSVYYVLSLTIPSLGLLVKFERITMTSFMLRCSDPFRALWDANPSQRFIYGLDWLPDPRCVLMSYDDGTLGMVSLLRAAYNVPVTGEPFIGTLQQGVHSCSCSSYAIWSIHVSQITEMVVYCCTDGTVLYFQVSVASSSIKFHYACAYLCS